MLTIPTKPPVELSPEMRLLIFTVERQERISNMPLTALETRLPHEVAFVMIRPATCRFLMVALPTLRKGAERVVTLSYWMVSVWPLPSNVPL